MDTKRKVQSQNLESVLLEFDNRRETLTSFCAKTKALIEECLQDANIRYQSVQARVKSRKKLGEKYSDPQKSYTRLDDITDLAGLRVITYYEDEVDLVAEVIRREFEIDHKNSIDRRDGNVDGFSYHAINFVCQHSKNRLASVEYKRFTEVCCEIQITSVLRHAWAEIEHDWYDLKNAFPPEIKRRFYRMAALLEVDESEFLELRKKRQGYERSIAVQIEANVTGIPLNAVSITSFIDQDPVVSEIDHDLMLAFEASSVVMNPNQGETAALITQLLGLLTVEDLRSELKKHRADIIKFATVSRLLIQRPANAPLAKGACIFRMGFLLSAQKGEKDLTNFLASVSSAVNLPAAVDHKKLVELAHAV